VLRWGRPWQLGGRARGGALCEAVGEEQVAVVANLGHLGRQARHQHGRAQVQQRQACEPAARICYNDPGKLQPPRVALIKIQAVGDNGLARTCSINCTCDCMVVFHACARIYKSTISRWTS